MSVCQSFHPNGTTRFTLKGFSWNFKFEYSSKICRENSSFIKTRQQYGDINIKTNILFWSYLAQFLLEWNMFDTQAVDKIKTHVSCSVTITNRVFIGWHGKILYSRPGHRFKCSAFTLNAGYVSLHALRLWSTHRFSTTIMAARTRLNVTLYVYCLSCLNYGNVFQYIVLQSLRIHSLVSCQLI